MSIRTRIADWLLAGRGHHVQARLTNTRAFDSARSDDLTFGFRPTNAAIDEELHNSLERLRGRSRTLAQNNDHMKRYLQMVVANIVGPHGFTQQSQIVEGAQPDGLANRLIETAFAEWCRRGACEVSGQYSFADVQSIAIETIARDGECLVRRVRGPAAGNRWRYSLQVLDIDRLPIRMNETMRNGNVVRMGVEMNSLGRPVAYHLLPKHPGSAEWSSVGTPERVPVGDMFHLFRPIRPEQRRGVPWAHTAMIRLEMLDKYEDAALVAARNGAERLGFFKSATGDTPVFDGKDPAGNSIITSVPGAFDTLPAGYEFQPFQTQYPDEAFGPFLTWAIRSIASGLGVSYVSLANDLTGVSYSSIRAGVLEERDMWMQIQAWFDEAFLRPVFLDWIETALLAGAIRFENGSALPAAKVAKFAVHSWQPRRWAWVDPLKDVQANIVAIREGLKSRRQVISEQGADLEDTWSQLAAEQQMAADMGLSLGVAMPAPDPATAPGPATSSD